MFAIESIKICKPGGRLENESRSPAGAIAPDGTHWNCLSWKKISPHCLPNWHRQPVGSATAQPLKKLVEPSNFRRPIPNANRQGSTG
jgi:hypothetical protein